MRALATLFPFYAACLAVALAATPIYGNDIRLGGKKEEKTIKNIVELPMIAVAIRTEDGGWKHISINAWLAPKDPDVARKMESLKSTIISKADRELPNHSYATLQSAELGAAEAKKAIHAAAAACLGHPWAGEVLIQNMLVY